MGFKVGLHTGGIIPLASRTCTANAGLGGIDVKAPPTDAALYERVTGRTHAALHFLEAFECFKRPGFHLNVEPPLTLTIFPIRNFLELAVWLKSERVDTFALTDLSSPKRDLCNIASCWK